MVLDEQAKKALIERLKAGRAKKKAEKEAMAPPPKAPKLKPAPKPRKVEYKDLTKIVDVEEPIESENEIVEVQPTPQIVVNEPKVAKEPEPVPEPKPVAIKPKKEDKERFLKVVWYKEPSKKQLKILDTIEDSSSEEDEPVKPPKITKKAVAKLPKMPRVIEPTAEEKRQAYLKRLADEWF
jgi:hypothetical protein